MNLFYDVSQQCSKITTEKYSTSFSSAIKLLHKDIRTPIYNIYGFVRFADEIVDTFHDFDRSAFCSNLNRKLMMQSKGNSVYILYLTAFK